MNELKNIYIEIFNCTDCPLKGQEGKATHRGNPNSKVFVLGQNPGAEEVKTNKAFIGQAGQIFDKIVYESIGIRTDSFYLSNVCRCKTPSNRMPTIREQNSCKKYWVAELNFIQPNVLILLGSLAIKAVGIFGPQFRMKDLVNTTVRTAPVPNGREILIIPCYHPAAVLYEKQKGTTVVSDSIRKTMEDNRASIYSNLS